MNRLNSSQQPSQQMESPSLLDGRRYISMPPKKLIPAKRNPTGLQNGVPVIKKGKSALKPNAALVVNEDILQKLKNQNRALITAANQKEQRRTTPAQKTPKFAHSTPLPTVITAGGKVFKPVTMKQISASGKIQSSTVKPFMTSSMSQELSPVLSNVEPGTTEETQFKEHEPVENGNEIEIAMPEANQDQEDDDMFEESQRFIETPNIGTPNFPDRSLIEDQDNADEQGSLDGDKTMFDPLALEHIEQIDIKDTEQLQELENELHNRNCCPGCRGRQDSNTNRSIRIEEKVDAVLELVKKIAINPPSTAPGKKPRILPPFPLDAVQDLLNFEKLLVSSNDAESEFMQAVSHCGGDSVKNAVKNVMKKLMTNQLADVCTWSIQKPNKIVIGEMRFVNLITAIVMDFPKLTDNTEANVKSEIQLWIRKPSDRLNKKNEQ